MAEVDSTESQLAQEVKTGDKLVPLKPVVTGVTLWEQAASTIGEDAEIVRQVYLMIGMGYSQEEIRAALEIDRRRIVPIIEALNKTQEERGPDELLIDAVGGYMISNNFVRDELNELYQDAKKNHMAHRQGLTRHDDGSPVRRVPLRDVIGLLTAIDGQAQRMMQAKVGLYRIKDAARKGKGNPLPVPAGDDFDPASLSEPIDIDATVL